MKQEVDINIPEGRTIMNAVTIYQHVDLVAELGDPEGEAQITMQATEGLTVWEIVGMLDLMKETLMDQVRSGRPS